MGLGVGIFLVTLGAILAFAVDASVRGVEIHTIGWILLVVGVVGILLSLLAFDDFGYRRWRRWGG